MCTVAKLLKDRRASGQILTMVALIPIILLLFGTMVDVSVATSIQTFVSEAALQGARVGSRSAFSVEAAEAAVLRFGHGIAGWRIGDRLTVDATLSAAGDILIVEVVYTYTGFIGRSQVARASSSVYLVDTP